MNARDRQILNALGEGRGQIICGCGDTLTVDGIPCADQNTSLRLMWAGHIKRGKDGKFGQRVPAVLGPAGVAALAPHPRTAVAA